jgi:hypothetical protein
VRILTKVLKKSIFLIIFFLACLGSIQADLLVTNWKENVVFNDKGREVSVTLDLVADGLEKNYYYTAWSFSFDKKSKVNVLESKILNSHNENKIDFDNNKLIFNFGKLFDREKVSIKFKYQEINEELENLKYMRQEGVSIPKWIKGKVVLRVTTPKDLEVYSLNEKFTKQGNIYTWSGVVDKEDGFFDVFQMTMKKAKWEVSTRVEFTNDFNIKNITGEIPLNYAGGNNSIIEYTVYNNQVNHIDNDRIKKGDNTVTVNFLNLNSTSGFIEIRSLLENNYNNSYWLNDLDLNTILTVDNRYESLLMTLAHKILEQDKSNLPIYVKIGNWVHKNIKYDLQYYGKTMDSVEILKEKKGVCEHYAILYQDLLRTLGMPAQTVSGISYSYDKKAFENHAWVIVNYNNNWLPLDPTWGIFSGKLPISHIFMSNYIKSPYSFSTTGKMKNFKIDIKNSATFVE